MLKMHERAEKYLSRHTWCGGIKSSYMGMFYPDIVTIFLFQIIPLEKSEEWVWVIVGDLPSAYIASDDCQTPAAALDGYIGEAQEWVNAVEIGASIDNLIPINVPPTKEYAVKLKRRLEFLDEHILSAHKDELASD
jgi:hypothetical protein